MKGRMLELHKRLNAQQTMMQKMMTDFKAQITRLGAVQAVKSQLTAA